MKVEFLDDELNGLELVILGSEFLKAKDDLTVECQPAMNAIKTAAMAMMIAGIELSRIIFPSLPAALTVAHAAITPLILIILPKPPPTFCKATASVGSISSILAVSNCNGAKRMLETVHEPAKNVPKIPMNGAAARYALPITAAMVLAMQLSIPGNSAPLSAEAIIT